MNTPPARPFGAVLTAMVTPFTREGDLDLTAAERLADHLVNAGNDGLVISGTTGEAPTTTDAEQADLLRAVVQAVGGRAKVVAGVGTNDTRHSVDLAKSAARCGADGLLVVTPYYSKPTQDGLVANLKAIAEATVLPIMLYDIPARTALGIADETFLELAKIPTVVAVKDATDDIHRAARNHQATSLAWYCGVDELNLAHLVMGTGGMVSVCGHIYADRLAAMVQAVDRGDLHAAREAHLSMLPGIQALMRLAPGAVMAKVALRQLGLLPTDTVRLPLTLPAPSLTEQALSLLASTGITSLEHSA